MKEILAIPLIHVVDYARGRQLGEGVTRARQVLTSARIRTGGVHTMDPTIQRRPLNSSAVLDLKN